MNRTIKDATVKRYFYETHDQLRAHLRDFVDAYNFARRLKTLKGLTPHESSAKPGLPAAKIHNQPAPENVGTKQPGQRRLPVFLLRRDDASETHACASDDLLPDDARARALPPAATARARRFGR
jgi:hypothetical protein